MLLAPITLFVYSRPWHTQQTIEALQKNKLASQSELIIYSDEAKNENAKENVNKTREYIDKIDGFKKITIIKRDKNLGLANSIIDGVTNVVNQYGKIIVLEDDLVTSPYFLQFMNDALEVYKREEQIASIHGYVFPISGLPDTFFIKGADCWGWATWKDRWSIFESDGRKILNELKQKKLGKELDFNGLYPYTKMLKDQIQGKNHSWAIRWYVSAFLKNMLTLYPAQSYVQNIGFGGNGTNCTTATNIFDVNLNYSSKTLEKIIVEENLKARKKIELFYKSIKPSFFTQVKAKIRKILGL